MKKYFTSLLIAFLAVSCLDKVDMPDDIVNKLGVPTVTMDSDVESLIEKTMTCEGTIQSTGKGKSIKSRGFCWSENNQSPTKSDSWKESGDHAETFFATIENIKGSTTYYIRAFAENEYGIAYSENTITYNSPLIWKEMSRFSGQLRINESICSIENKLYISCGQRTQNPFDPLGDTWRFDIQKNVWQALGDFPGNKRMQSATFTIGNSVYVGCGRSNIDSITYFNDFYKLTNDSWESIVISPFTARNAPIGLSASGKGYLIGGTNISVVNAEVWEYSDDKQNKGWKRLNDFPVAIYSGISFCTKDRFFAGFGIVDQTDGKRVWEYDRENDRWDLYTTAPEDMGIPYSGVTIGNKAYISDQFAIWELDLETKTWKTKTPLPDSLSGNDKGQCMFSTGHSIYIGLSGSDILFEYKPLWE